MILAGIGNVMISSGFPFIVRRATLEVCLQRLVIRIDSSSSITVTTVRSLDETRQIINVAIGIVALDTVAEPENFAHAEIIAQPLLDFLPRQVADCDLDSANTLPW